MTAQAPRASSDVEGDASLRARREVAAACSGGTSDNVYPSFTRVLADRGLAGDVLDFGAGTGTLTRQLLASGAFGQVTGADIMARPDDLPASVKWVTADLNDATPLPSGTFDTIVSAEVIEHLENPRAVAREWFRLLKPGGRLLLSTPNNESWRALVSLVKLGHFVHFRDEAYPAHITALVRKDIERILTEAGFDAPEFFFSDLGGIPGRPLVTWQSISRRLTGLRFSDNVLALARKSA